MAQHLFPKGTSFLNHDHFPTCGLTMVQSLLSLLSLSLSSTYISTPTLLLDIDRVKHRLPPPAILLIRVMGATPSLAAPSPASASPAAPPCVGGHDAPSNSSKQFLRGHPIAPMHRLLDRMAKHVPHAHQVVLPLMIFGVAFITVPPVVVEMMPDSEPQAGTADGLRDDLPSAALDAHGEYGAE